MSRQIRIPETLLERLAEFHANPVTAIELALRELEVKDEVLKALMSGLQVTQNGAIVAQNDTKSPNLGQNDPQESWDSMGANLQLE